VVARGLVLGLGNPILTDDGVGIHVARAVANQIHCDDLTVAEASVGGLRLLDVLAGYSWAIIVDAVLTEAGRPGDVTRLQPGDLRASLHSGSTHDLSLSGALALGRQIGMALPADDRIVLVAIEAEDVLTFGESCTEPVAAAVPRAAQVVQALVVMFLDKDCEVEYN
jgi:hydrogenase maturation protease